MTTVGTKRKAAPGIVVEDDDYSVERFWSKQDDETVSTCPSAGKRDWRGELNEMLSDWTIEIVQDDGSRRETYHVHRFAFHFGGRRSDYFARKFHTQCREVEQRKSEIVLSQETAKAFPDLLFYLYNPSLTLKRILSSRKNLVALYCLGDYFEMRKLRRDSLKLIREWHDSHQLYHFHLQATKFELKPVLCVLAELTAKNLDKIWPRSDIVRYSNARFWENVRHKLPKKYDSILLSRHIADFCEDNFVTLTVKMFETITDADKLPLLCPKAALRLSLVEDRICHQEYGKHCADPIAISSIKSRCIDSLNERSKLQEHKHDKDIITLLDQQKASFVRKLWQGHGRT